MDQLLETTCLQSINRSGRCAMEGTTEGQLAPKSEYHRDVWIMWATPGLRRPCRTGKQWTSSDDRWSRAWSSAQVRKAKGVTSSSGVRRELRALANPLESHPYATRACNPHRITFLRKTMGRGYRPANTNLSIPGEPPAAPFAVAVFHFRL